MIMLFKVSSRHKDIDSTVQSFYDKGFVTKEEEEKYGMVIFHIGKKNKNY